MAKKSRQKRRDKRVVVFITTFKNKEDKQNPLTGFCFFSYCTNCIIIVA